MLDLCEELGIGLVPWSPLGAGLLTVSITADTRFDESDYRATNPRFTPAALPANLALLELAREWGRRKQATPAQIALPGCLPSVPGSCRSRAPPTRRIGTRTSAPSK